ncbi:MAG: LPS export ABC transporter periplasmic protein LptC [Candidatus Omnitrophica bacterium]|nr:LPS export ABC transporter periplasmic protein LptC [Candidatus Omnitrophota bacterium]
MRHWTLVIVSCILVIFHCLLISGCGRKEPPKTPPAASVRPEKEGAAGKGQPGGVEHKVLSFNLEGMTEKGEKKWEVIGRTAKSISENEIHIGNIVARTYGTDEAVITADRGVYDKSKNNVRLRENVVATIENAGSTLKDQMSLSPFPGDPAKNDAAKDAASKPKEKKKIVITCDGEVEFDYAKNLAYFNDNVKVRSSDGDIDADKITVNLNPGTKKINDIVAQGHVKITQRDNVAYGDNASYNEADSKVSISGNSKIVIVQDGDNVIKDAFAGR